MARVLPDTAGLAVLDPRLPRPGQLFPVEEQAIAHAVPTRRDAFIAGRVAARSAMTDIGLTPAPIPMGPDRAPVWPAGVIGSISHCAALCVAVVARAGDIAALGIDVEKATPLARDLWNEILRPEERAWLERQPAADRGLHAKEIFSAKEAIYKAIYPQERRILEFHEIALSPNAGGFTARRTGPGDPPPPVQVVPLAGGVIASLALALPGRA